MGLRAFEVARKEWRDTWPKPGRRPDLAAELRQPPLELAPRPGSIRAVRAGMLSWATYWKHALMPTMALDQEVVGYVSMMNRRPNEDGDITVDVVPLPDYAPILRYEGRYRPRIPLPGALAKTRHTPEGIAMAMRCGAIHCEFKADKLPVVQPFLLEIARLVDLGRTPVVSIRGRWTFDPFHGGWVEIHPARAAQLLSATGEGHPQPLPLPPDAAGGKDDEP